MIALLLALALSAPPKPLKAQPFKPLDLARGKVTLPLLGLELDLTPAAGGIAGASWRISSEIDGTTYSDWLEARVDDVVVGTAEVTTTPDCTELMATQGKPLPTFGSTWLGWNDGVGATTRYLYCHEDRASLPFGIVVRRQWHDAKYRLPLEDDPVVSAIAFALRDNRYGKARPRVDALVERKVALASELTLPQFPGPLPMPTDGAIWRLDSNGQRTFLNRVAPALPVVAIELQLREDPALCPARPKGLAWGRIGPTARCRPLVDGRGVLLLDVVGPSELAQPLLDELAKATARKAAR